MFLERNILLIKICEQHKGKIKKPTYRRFLSKFAASFCFVIVTGDGITDFFKIVFFAGNSENKIYYTQFNN